MLYIISVDYYNNTPVLLLLKEPLEDPLKEVSKRLFDIFFSIFIIILIFPWLIVFISILIKISSRGHVFFKQLRTGMDGKNFYCYKFRTMKYPYWYWKKFFQLKEIKNINKFILNNYNLIESSEKAAKNLNGENKKNVKCYLINYGKVKNLISNSLNNFFEINNYHFGFDLYPLLDLTNINYNIYTSEDKSNYDWHLDLTSDPSLPCRKLTVVLMLSSPDDYKGGDLEILINNAPTVLERKKGRLYVFPSFMLHRVTPVVSGVRKTLVSWVSGNKFR
jgi:hypothetical protein